jgi:hypothetical protein
MKRSAYLALENNATRPATELMGGIRDDKDDWRKFCNIHDEDYRKFGNIYDED